MTKLVVLLVDIYSVFLRTHKHHTPPSSQISVPSQIQSIRLSSVDPSPPFPSSASLQHPIRWADGAPRCYLLHSDAGKLLQWRFNKI
ncbi:hypothetical protein JTE90_008148 [Oedothorax gibbosus]|uniref:Uncharacterized protein n=1 Tax=Oedothorax gibbosus TaxID=931172 RepID=A0AAV6VDV3_9ARAC|nr:hypothetical protein JTE90_008148 [Oedothorax gibbosus]